MRLKTLAPGSAIPAGAIKEKVRGCIVLCFVVVAMLAAAGTAHAQLNGLHLKGDAGLDSGSQAPPGAYWGTLFYLYNTSRINNQSGTQVNTAGSLTVPAGLGLISVVTKQKFLGANYGFTVIPAAILKTTIESPRLNANSGVGFGDIYIQPVNLGWHLEQADVTTGFGIFLPTGRYTADNANDNNVGLGMWGFEPSIGTTVHLNKTKTWNASALASFEFHTDKRDTKQHVGNLLTLEGGLGRKFLKGAANAGVAYYTQWKLSDDRLAALPTLLVKGKNSTAAIGPELTIPLATKSKLYGFFTVRYEFEVASRTTTQGNALILTAVFPFKPIKLK
ncbi:MAG: transporter [Candidatus Solibacter sp.]|nr:transporter [Candidatus Solibacter sp.]